MAEGMNNMNYKIRLKLYLESQLPVFLIIGLFNLKKDTIVAIFQENIILGLYHFFRNNCLSIFFLTVGILVLVEMFAKFQPKDTVVLERDAKKYVVSHRLSYWLFLFTTVFPMVAAYRYGFKGKALMLIILLAAGVGAMHTSLYYRHPVLWILGYRVLECFDECDEYKILILAGKITPEEIREKQIVKISNTEGLVLNGDLLWRRKNLYACICWLLNTFLIVSEKTVRIISKIYCICKSRIVTAIEKRPFLFSLLYSSGIMSVMWLLGQMRWEGADDFTMSQLLMGSSGEMTPYVLTSSYYLGIFVNWIQEALPIMNWFTGLEIISVWISFTVMEWFLLKHSTDRGKLYALAFPIMIEPLYFSLLQYTRSSFILPFAGLLMIYDATMCNIRFELPEHPAENWGGGASSRFCLARCFLLLVRYLDLHASMQGWLMWAF